MLVVVVVLVTALLPARWAAVVSDPPRHLLRALLAPTTHLIKPLADSWARPPESELDHGGVVQLRANYEQALQYNRRLEDQLEDARRKIAQLSQIRQELSLTGVELLPAAVTSWSGDAVYPAMTLDRGGRNRLRAGLVVAHGFNLIGRVTDAGPLSSRVGLITAPGTQLVVRIVPAIPGASPRELVCLIEAEKGTESFWTITGSTEPVRVGDLAHLSDDSWPDEARGLVVGRVTGVEKDQSDPTLRNRVIVTPVRQLRYLNRVVVMLPGAPDVGDGPGSH